MQFHSLGYGAGHTQKAFVLFCFVDCVLLLEFMGSTDMLLAQYIELSKERASLESA